MQVRDIRLVSSDLLGATVIAVDRIYGGRNSQVFKLTCADSTRYALKHYSRDRLDGRDRLGAEFSSLRFLWDQGVRCIPQPVIADEKLSYGVYEFIDGHKILPDEVAEDDIDQSVRFLSRLNNLTQRDGSASLPIASEACFSSDAIAANIGSRLGRLQEIKCTGAQYDEMDTFLADAFEPLLNEVVDWCKDNLVETNTPFDSELTDGYKTLSPSDFGFHNALNRGGEVIFLDFEYFGWDDPAKTLSDFLLHPAMPLPENLRRRFVGNFLSEFHDEGEIARRLMAVYPLFGLKWCLILLNEFIPENLGRREFAGGGDMDRETLQFQQLSKARYMLNRVTKEYRDFPYYG